MVKGWLIRFWSLATLFAASLGTLLGLLPFTTALGMVLLAVSLISGAALLLLGRGRREQWPKAARFFSWWTISLAVFALMLTLMLTGAFGSCERVIERSAGEARERELIEE